MDSRMKMQIKKRFSEIESQPKWTESWTGLEEHFFKRLCELVEEYNPKFVALARTESKDLPLDLVIKLTVCTTLLRLRSPVKESAHINEKLSISDQFFNTARKHHLADYGEIAIANALPRVQTSLTKKDAMLFEQLNHQKTGLQGCLGFIDVISIQVSPNASMMEYNARTGNNEYQLLIIVSADKYIWYYELFPGSFTARRCWESSLLYAHQFGPDAPKRGELPLGFRCRDESCDLYVEPHVLGDRGFSLSRCGIVRGCDRDHTDEKSYAKADTHCWERAAMMHRMVVEDAAKELLDAFSRINSGLTHPSSAVAAAIAMHNADIAWYLMQLDHCQRHMGLFTHPDASRCSYLATDKICPPHKCFGCPTGEVEETWPPLRTDDAFANGFVQSARKRPIDEREYKAVAFDQLLMVDDGGNLDYNILPVEPEEPTTDNPSFHFDLRPVVRRMKARGYSSKEQCLADSKRTMELTGGKKRVPLPKRPVQEWRPTTPKRWWRENPKRETIDGSSYEPKED